MNNEIKSQTGFTLVELLIVVLILGILAAVAIPHFGSSTEDAKLSTLQSNLSSMRSSIERYYHEHSAVNPGEKAQDSGVDVVTADACEAAFIAQLTLYSANTGVTSNTKTGAAKYGPYIKSVKIPTNPFTGNNTVLCDNTNTDITVAASTTAGGEAWKFYMKTGRLIANDGSHDSL